MCRPGRTAPPSFATDRPASGGLARLRLRQGAQGFVGPLARIYRPLFRHPAGAAGAGSGHGHPPSAEGG